MFFKTLFITVPKSVNEYIFILGLISIIISFRKKRCLLSVQHKALSIIIILMVIWRSLYGIISSRYASGLVIPFTLSSVFFIDFLLKKTKFSKIFALICIILVSISWTKKTLYISQNNSNIRFIAEIPQKAYNKNKEYLYITNKKERNRIEYYGNNKFTKYYETTQNTEDISFFAKEYKTINFDIFYYTVLKSGEKSALDASSKYTKSKQVLSLFTQKNKTNKHCLYLIEPLSSYRIISNNYFGLKDFDSGLLQNGDLELVDSENETLQKLKDHVHCYTSLYELNPDIRTPQNAYFYNAKKKTQDFPVFNCTNENAISGTRSVYIDLNTKSFAGYLFFKQKNYNGDYEYSLCVKGKKDTIICMLYDTHQDGKWKVVPLAYFIIPNNLTYMIESHFKIKDLDRNDFFIVGASVCNGEVYLDSFKLIRYE